jgi:hypothetical protein
MLTDLNILLLVTAASIKEGVPLFEQLTYRWQ